MRISHGIAIETGTVVTLIITYGMIPGDVLIIYGLNMLTWSYVIFGGKGDKGDKLLYTNREQVWYWSSAIIAMVTTIGLVKASLEANMPWLVLFNTLCWPAWAIHTGMCYYVRSNERRMKMIEKEKEKLETAIYTQAREFRQLIEQQAEQIRTAQSTTDNMRDIGSTTCSIKLIRRRRGIHKNARR